MDTRKCTFCKIEKPLSEFGKHVRCKDGIRPNCLACHRDDMRSRRKDPTYRAHEQAYRKANRKPRDPGGVTFLYVWTRHDGVPLYVGISSDWHARTRAHALAEYVWTDYAVKPTKARRFKTRAAAEAAEAKLIAKYASSGIRLVNKTHNPLHTGPEFYLDVVSEARSVMQQVVV